MKIKKLILSITILSCSCMQFGCSRSAGDTWEDAKTAGRHMSRGFKTLSGDYQESRLFKNPQEFEGSCPPPGAQYAPPPMNYRQSSYIPLKDEEVSRQLDLDGFTPQPSRTPGETGSNLPGIDGFSDPVRADQIKVFQNIHFDTNDHTVKGAENQKIILKIASYMKQNPKLSLFIEGHCDKRGPAAYNLALGARRSNSVRSFLVKEGISPEKLFTISYGKERPIALGDDAESLQINRRAQFKLYNQ